MTNFEKLKEKYRHTDLSNELKKHIHIYIGEQVISIVEEKNSNGIHDLEYFIFGGIQSEGRYQTYDQVVALIESLKGYNHDEISVC